MGKIKNLKTLNNRTVYVGNESKFSKGCSSCLLGNGVSAIRKTNKYNLECRFCYNYGELKDISAIWIREFPSIPFESFLAILSDYKFQFLIEEEVPKDYKAVLLDIEFS